MDLSGPERPISTLSGGVTAVFIFASLLNMGQLLKARICSFRSKLFSLALQAPKVKIVELANSVDPDEVAHNEPPYLNLHFLPCNVRILNMISLGQDIF